MTDSGDWLEHIILGVPTLCVLAVYVAVAWWVLNG